jgi:hypothetical protein
MYVCLSIYYSYLMHRPLPALAGTPPPAGALGLIQPRASAIPLVMTIDKILSVYRSSSIALS